MKADLTLSTLLAILSNTLDITEKSLFANAAVNSSKDLVISANFLGVISGISLSKALPIGSITFCNIFRVLAKPLTKLSNPPKSFHS